jgi:hypothetical protein
VASAKATLVKDGHYDEKGEFTDKPWEAKEYIAVKKDSVYIVEGILSLYDLPEVANGRRLSSKYVSNIFIDADYDVRLTRGILRMKERLRESEDREPTDEEIMNYAYQFWHRQREEELVISESADRSNAVRVSNQTRAEDIFVLFKDGELMLPTNLDVLGEMGVLPYRSQRRLEEKGEEWVKKYLRDHFEGKSFDKVKDRKSGSSFEVFFIGGGLVLKVYKKPKRFDEDEAEFFEKVLKQRAGGILVPGIILDISDLNITETVSGKKRKLGRVLIQNTGESFEERVSALLKEGNIEKAKKLIDEFFELQKKMWSVGIIDKDPQIMKEYGIIIDNGKEKLVAFVSNSMSNNPGHYAPKNYDADEEKIPAVLKEHYRKRKFETIVEKDTFTREVFEKDLQNAEPLHDISHGEVNYQQLKHVITLMAEQKVLLLERCFNEMGVKGKLAAVVWIKAFVESVLRMNIPEDTQLCGNLEEFAISLVENPKILDEMKIKSTRKILGEHIPAYDTVRQKQFDMFLKVLYRIHRKNKKKADVRTDMENVLASDKMLMNILTEDLLCGTPITDEAKVYRIKYDVSKLSNIQVEILKAYSSILEEKLARGSAIRLHPFSSGPEEPDSPVISVECITKKGELKGRGEVCVKLYEGERVGEYPLSVTGMINLAFAASNIPKGTPQSELNEEYGYLLGFMRNQYKFITGTDLNINFGAAKSEDPSTISVMLELPPASKKLPSYLMEYYQATLRALVAA